MNKKELSAAIQEWNQRYDEQLHLIRIPNTATYHTALKATTYPFVHGLVRSTYYAYELLEIGNPGNIERAVAVLHAVLPLQDKNPLRDTYGIWPYFYEEALDEMDRPDWNMADFHGKKLVQILKRHAHKLPQTLVAEIRETVTHACYAIKKRNVGPGYTNIAIMGAFVTLAGGEVLDNEELRQYGLARLRTFHNFTCHIGTFTKYNSPVYTPIAIEELHSISVDSATPEAVELAKELLDLAWGIVAKHYHPATGEWSGPYSRTYSTMLNRVDGENRFLREALSKEESDLPASTFRCPEHYHPLFSAKDQRYQCVPIMSVADEGYQCYATTFQNDKLSLGSFSHSFMWNQRRNLLGFVEVEGKAVYVQLQFLMNGKDFCSAIYSGAQHQSEVLFGLNLAIDNGAWHEQLDRIDGRFRASDLRIRVEVGGHTASLEEPAVVAGKRLELEIGDVSLAVEPILEQSDYGPLLVEWDRSEGKLLLDYVIYSGEERAFDLHEQQHGLWMFYLSLSEGRPSPVIHTRVEQGEGFAEYEKDGESMSLQMPMRPAPTKELYIRNQVTLPRELIGTN